jgi:hypothetical protein
MRITLDTADLEELQQLAGEASASTRPARAKLGLQLQGAIVAAFRRHGLPGYRIVGRTEPTEHARAELPSDREAYAQRALLMARVIGRPFYTLKDSDVGRATIRAFGRTVPATHFADAVGRMDVGRRVYDVDGIVQLETDEQRGARLRNPDELGAP